MVGTRPTKVRPTLGVGRVLVESRTQKGVSLDQVSETLNIPLEQLAAMEAGDFSVFAAEVYARGAYLAYARYLGIDVRRVEPKMLEVLSGARQRVPLTLPLPASWVSRWLTPRVVFLGGLALVGSIFGAYIAWQIQSFLVLPSLIVNTPHSLVVEDPSITVQGQGEKGGRIRVNGEAVLLDADGNFSLPLSLHQGTNVVRVESENAAGRVRVVERIVLLHKH